MSDVYGIGNKDGVVLSGLSREESLSYIECDGRPGDRIIRRHEGVWYETATGNVFSSEKPKGKS